MKLFNSIRWFNISGYLSGLEKKFHVNKSIKKGYKTFIATYPNLEITKETVIEFETYFRNLMDLNLKNGHITSFGINSLAGGVIQIWFKTSFQQKNPEFVVVNLHK